MRYDEAVRRLRRLGCYEIPRRGKGGSHYAKWHNPATGETRPLPDWGTRDLKIGTLEAVVKGLGLDWEEFRSGGKGR